MIEPLSPRALRLAHRGDWRRAPENTIAAFLAALDVPGCDGLEFDVRASRDGVAVCYHDDTLLRVHGLHDRVADLTADELERLGVPSLEQVLATAPRRAFLDIELKGDPGRGAFETIVAGRGPGLERAVVSSFWDATLARIADWAPTWPRWLNSRDASPHTIGRAVDLGCRGVSIEWHALDPAGIGRARDAGLEVATWTVRRRATYRRFERLGVVAICARPRPSTADRSSTAHPARPSRRADRRRPAPAYPPDVSSTERADLVVVGAGTIGGWASTFAAMDGAGRVVVVERGDRRARARAAARRGSSGPRAGRRQPSPSAAGRSTSTVVSRRRSAPTAASASSAT